MSLRRLLITASVLLTTTSVSSNAFAQSKGTPGKFDFYVLALSWSPDYCAAKGDSDPQQCKQGKKLGFVLHGLWPQYQKGYPASCTTERLPETVKQQFPNLFPSAKLYNHEWQKHGTCTGLTPAQYLTLSKQKKDSVSIPTDYAKPSKPFRTTINKLQSDFVGANPAFTSLSIAPSCSGSGRFLQEILVCFTKDGKPGPCSAEVIRRSLLSCGQSDFLVRNVR
ncbi:ribonuclease [Dulcicalothrix desertica PCC 7102]|uniref:Ribonuclease n=1 Tax=Dulcicalothrix desertica PCC 7102 TaxID=232991 RepID=A0A3S1AJQ4_9CYAN|nr:ribonuclease [Dulcicalothrix desertica]RUT02489.1 ribonuclease [Dulcicalothrix desertica PCC 7102]TWH55294.1 ribonuclease T2 [Dulcicalothrix desertica PCC 7102]